MKAAIVREAGQTPVYAEFTEPVAAAGENRISVTAAALSPVVKTRASGAHYSVSSGYPFGVGIDGVGRLDNGRRVYFFLPHAPYGSMAERTVVPAAQCAPVPDELDDITAAAIAVPGMSSWAALTQRAKLAHGATVLINGATSTAGRLAVAIAKRLGAGKVIATGRNAAVLQSLPALGADVTIPLGGDTDALEAAFKQQLANGIDIVLDFVWGQSAERLLIAVGKSGMGTVPIRFIQIGNASGPTITLAAPILRSRAIELIGCGLGSVSPQAIVKACGELFGAVVGGGFAIATKAVPLSEIAQAWPVPGFNPRIVFTVGKAEGNEP